ncbi:MAG: thiamine pyrophosphate-dependent enzyme [Chlamydiales bacterium]|nr:thiamine pyrophosphate-dependent enzyme [Chlamydiales bacterium]
MNKCFSKEKCLEVLRDMLLSRFTDDKMAKLVRQNKGATFQLSAAGHELVGVVAAKHLMPGKDWGLPYYRDQPFAIGLGCSLKEIFGAFLSRDVKNHSAGRMMPGHFSHKDLRIPCQSSVVGSQFLHAVGVAQGVKLRGEDEVVYVSSGDGATSQGDFHEALNYSGLHQLPVIFMVQDNGWAISVPVTEQTAGGSIAHVARGHQGVETSEVDGCSYEEVSSAMQRAVSRARSGFGPSVIIAKVPRLAAHSSSDDPQKYKSLEHVEEEKARDPIPIYEQFLIVNHLATEEEIASIKKEAFHFVELSANEAEELPVPEKGSSSKHVFAKEPVIAKTSLLENPISEDKIVIMDAINHALDEEMQRDTGVIVFGQDVAHGKGGVFGVTKKLTDKYGKMRCFNTPLAESTIIGVALGVSLDGIHKPVAEIQFADYLWTGINQLFNELSSIHYRSNGEWNCPVVIRMPCGGYIQGGPYHSQSIEGFLSHCPGLVVVIPSNASDAKGLMKSAIRSPNPVIFLEHKALYRQQKFAARREPSADYLVPFGKASVVREGSDLTVVAWGLMVLMALDAAEKLSAKGISVEVIDLRSIVPLDIDTILESVKKTGKLLIVHEAARNCGFGAEIAAQVVEKAFAYLDAPIERVCAMDTPVPYCKTLENEVLPQPEDIEKVMHKLASF